MSQYERDFGEGILSRVGWDPPLQCFFAHLRDEAVDEDANPVIWIGTGLGGDPNTFDELVRELRAELDVEGYTAHAANIMAWIQGLEPKLIADKEANHA